MSNDDVPVITAKDLAAHFDKKDAKVATKKAKTSVNRTAQQETTAVKVTTNQRKLVTADTYAAITAKYGDPLEALAEIAFSKEVDEQGAAFFTNPVEVRLGALKELVGYGHAKLKTIEHTGANGAPLEFKQTIVQNILQMMNPNAANTPEPRTITESD